MRKSNHFAEARTLQNSICYIDQKKRSLALVDSDGRILLAAAQKRNKDSEWYEDKIAVLSEGGYEGYQFFEVFGDNFYNFRMPLGRLKYDSETLLAIRDVISTIAWCDDMLTPVVECKGKMKHVYSLISNKKETKFKPATSEDAEYYTGKASELFNDSSEMWETIVEVDGEYVVLDANEEWVTLLRRQFNKR